MNSVENVLQTHLEASLNVLQKRLDGRTPRIGIILGSGLNPFADSIADAVRIPFAEVPHMKVSTANGHVGQFVCGNVAGTCVLAMQGRLHGYEGVSSQDVAYPVWLMEKLGVGILITTNAAGALNSAYHVGDFCIMSDQINFTGRNPIADADPARMADRFVSMLDAFDPSLRAIAHRVANAHGIRVQEGVYVGLLGPSFETPAEIRMLQAWGGDTVAMSVCEEVIAARHVCMRVLGISLVSNMGCGIDGANPSDLGVIDVAATRADDFSRLICGIVEQL
ncbi:purine-nucleoside phosphorylase [Adlercreutzia sp. ZJ141]|uniref:purine-nucleoside phosphorylase n=1 Tax=Adlercreutzia sp. ZJ141 TaxID=2709406 RepID=UPI0013EC0CBA|nr:purine-nucleoside phosphorylase [Adlercreutzia sp. ZJ141]